jgi:RNA polymerase sigma-70 factor (ECF subfamily)
VTTAAAAPATHKLDFEDLVREHQRMVFSIGYHFLHNAAAAEEVAQDVFLELFKRLGTLESPEHVTHWLRRVACHRCIDYSRRNKNAASEVSWDQLPEPVQPAGHSDLGNSDPMMSKRLHQMVAALPLKMRMVVILRYQQEAGLEEIASTMGIPLNTVKSTLHRAHAMLRAKMEQTVGKEWGEVNA